MIVVHPNPTERQQRRDAEAIFTLRRKYGPRALERAKLELEQREVKPERRWRLERIIPRMERGLTTG